MLCIECFGGPSGKEKDKEKDAQVMVTADCYRINMWTPDYIYVFRGISRGNPFVTWVQPVATASSPIRYVERVDKNLSSILVYLCCEWH